MTIDAPLQHQLPLLRDLFEQAFDETKDFLDTFYNVAFSKSRCRCVTEDEKIAAALYWFDCEYCGTRIAYLYAIATAKEFRGRGICHDLMANTHKHLASLGYQGAILVPASRSLFSFYQGMGYQPCSYIRKWECSASRKGIELRRIDVTEYAKLRQQLLPTGGVIQQNENLDLLNAISELYTGTGFLAAVTKQDDVLCAAEFLGDEAFASGIVGALGCEKGIFRTVGTDQPFAMYLPLGSSALPPPSYFGLAFD